MSGESDPSRLVDKLVGGALAVLVGAMALYGAVAIIASVWVPLCIGICAVLALVGGWMVFRRWRDW